MAKNVKETIALALNNETILAVIDILGVTAKQLIKNGAALLYSAINEIRREYQRINELHNQLDAAIAYEKLCASYGEPGKDELNEAHAARQAIQDEIWKLEAAKADKHLFGQAIKELKEIADPSTLAVMKCRDKQYASVAKAERTTPDGARTFELKDKIKLGNYKIMNIPVGETMREFQKYVLHAELSAQELKPDEVCEHISLLAERVQQMLENGEPIRVNIANAKVNQAKESLAAYIAGVKFNGKTTDRIITVSHDVHELIGKEIAESLGDDAETIIDNIEKNILKVMTNNGIEVTMLDGSILTYDVWAASASQQKLGEFYGGEREMMKRTADVRNICMAKEELLTVADNGPEMLKRQAVLFTPSAPMIDKNGNPVRLRDITMFPSIKTKKFFANVLDIDKFGNAKWLKFGKELERALFDGGLLALDESLAGLNGQGRGLYQKGCLVCVPNGIRMLAAIKGYEIPEEIETLSGTINPLDIRLLATMDVNKMNKLAKELGMSWMQFVETVESLRNRFPQIDQLRIVRYADSTEESPRRMARQAMQQLLTSSDELLKQLAVKPISKLAKYQTASGMLAEYAQLDKAPEDRTAYNRLFELVPSILASRHMATVIKDQFNEKLATYCASRVPVDGVYPYITEDPAAVLEILIFGKDPNTKGLGLLKPGQVNLPNCEEGKRMAAVRYPANLYTMMLFVNHNHPFYAYCGNTAILCVDDEFLIRDDGDVDGDEAAFIFNKVIIAMLESLLSSGIPMPLVSFPHDKADLCVMKTRRERRDAMAEALFIANKFGGAVGQNSLLATRWFNKAAVAHMNGNGDLRSFCGMQAMWAYIGSVLAIDMVKTGTMPKWLEIKLAQARKGMGKLPWNQRFAKHTVSTPWFDHDYWDVDPDHRTERESRSVCDRLARIILNGANAENYKFNTEGLEFDVELLLSHQEGLHGYWSDGVFDPSLIASLDARNYCEESDRKLLTAIHNGERVSAKDLMLFFWRNLASLKRKLAKEEDSTGSKAKTAAETNAYYAFVRRVMVNFGDNEKFQTMTPDQRRLSIVNAFVRDAFEVKRGNGIGKNYPNPAMAEHAKGTYAKFILSVFAPDILGNVEENLGIPEDERFIVEAPAEESGSEEPDLTSFVNPF